MKITLNNKHIWINYHHLYCFFVIASEGSIKGASKKLQIGVSALSIQIKQFEHQLGYSLFERSHRNLNLNENGRILLQYASEIFRLGTEMVQTLYNQTTPNHVPLNIGVLDSIPKHLSVQITQQALKTHRCSISIIEGKLTELTHLLLQHHLDLIVTNSTPRLQPGRVYSRKVARWPLVVVGSPKFAKLRKNFPKSLNATPMIVPTADSVVRQEIESYCKHHEIHPVFLVETQDVMTQKLLAIQHVGLTVVPKMAVEEYLHKKELVTIGVLENCFEELFLTSPSRKIENPVAAHLMKSFIQSARKA